MKTKPKEAVSRLNGLANCGSADPLFSELADWINALPDTFEIVEPGKVQVEWPKEWDSERLTDMANGLDAIGQHTTRNALRALAAIAPKKRTRMVNLWRKDGMRPDQLEAWSIGANPNRPDLWTLVASNVEIED